MDIPAPTPATVTLSSLQAAVASYPALITALDSTRASNSKQAHQTLAALDTFRYTTLPALIATRRKTSTPSASPHAQPLITKPELINLVTWKLSHGTYRPALMNHVTSNPDALITDTIRDAYAMLPAQPLDAAPSAQPTPPAQDLVRVLTVLAKPLKGIGPATASLLLSALFADSVPFFSDELYRWCVFADAKTDWRSVEIKYTMKEYAVLVDRLRDVRSRLAVLNEDGTRHLPSAVDLEKAAYVWARSVNSKQPKPAMPAGHAVPKPAAAKASFASEDDSLSPVTKKRKNPTTATDVTEPLRRSSRRRLS